jgi:hypothetical protein
VHIGLQFFDIPPVDAVKSDAVVWCLPGGDAVPVGFDFGV